MLARLYARALRLFVCLSQVGILSKRLNASKDKITTLPPTGKLRSFRSARFEVSLELIAELAAASITDQRVFTDVLTEQRVKTAFVVI